MKKNNSFKTTFYLGLIFLFVFTSITTLILFNLFNILSPKFKKDKIEIHIDDVKPEKEIVHDTIYLDKPCVKINNIPKNFTVIKPKLVPVVSKKTDTTVVLDTIK
jgi:hypothetical protein